MAVEQPAAQLALIPCACVVRRATQRRAEVSTFLSRDEIDSTLLIAGCDPQCEHSRQLARAPSFAGIRRDNPMLEHAGARHPGVRTKYMPPAFIYAIPKVASTISHRSDARSDADGRSS